MTTTRPLQMPRDWMMSLRQLAWAQTALLGIGIVALALRLTGIAAGLPAALFNDEAYLVDNALHIGWNDLNPHTFVWGSLSFYIVRLVTWTMEAIVRLFAGHGPTYTDYYLAVRLLSTGSSLGTLIVVYASASRLAGRLPGIAAAWLFAISPYAVELSHYASIETILTFWTALALYGVVLWNDGDERGRNIAAVAAGLAMATKYSALLLLLPIAIVAIDVTRRHAVPVTRGQRWLVVAGAVGLLLAFACALFFRDPLFQLAATWTNAGTLKPMYMQLYDRALAALLVPLAAAWLVLAGIASRWRWAIVSVRMLANRAPIQTMLMACIVFVLAEPFALLDFPAFAQGAAYDLAQQDAGPALGFGDSARSYDAANGQTAGTDLLYYVRAIVNEWGPLGVASMGAGLWYMWKTKRTALTALGLWLFVIVLAASLGRNYGPRYIAPAWGLLAVLAGAGVAAGIEALDILKVSRRWVVIGSVALIVVLSFVPVSATRDLLSTQFLRDDTRNLAYAWIASHIAPSASIIRVRELTTNVDTPPIERLSADYHVQIEAYLFENASLSVWRARGVEWIVTGDSRRAFYQAHAAQFADVLAEYDALARSSALAVSFLPNDATKGPPIYIYELK